MGESSLRKSIARKQAPELGGRYAGVKSSRDELFGGKKAALDGSDDGSDEEDEGEDDEDEDADADEDALEDDEDLDEDEELAALEGEESGSEGEDPTEDEEEASEGEDDEEEDAPVAKSIAKRSGKSSMEDDSRAMIQALKKASSADVEKGREVRRQLVSHGRILDCHKLNLIRCSAVLLGHTTRSTHPPAEVRDECQRPSRREFSLSVARCLRFLTDKRSHHSHRVYQTTPMPARPTLTRRSPR